MENALLVGLSRQMALGRELDVIANNVANVSTNGFKARSSRFADYLNKAASADSFRRPDRNLAYVIDAGTVMDTASGPFEATRNPMDVAIRGDAFLTVQTPAGERYTRNGALAVNAAGQLATSDGFPVLGENGPISFDRSESGIAIAADGLVSTKDAQKGRLRLVRFADARSLTNDGANTFSSSTPPEPAGATSRIESGFVERSNVKAVTEMTRLIEVNRTYASVSSMVGRLDEMRRTAIQRLADTQS